MSEYPKVMTRSGQEVSVAGAAEESEKRAEGWCSPLDEPATPQTDPDVRAVADADVAAVSEPVGDDPEDEPTFGPTGDQTHARRPARAAAGKKR